MLKGKRGLGGKRCVRRNVSLTNRLYTKINQLAISCNIDSAALMYLAIESCLNDEEWITLLQREHNKHRQYWVFPVKDFRTGEVLFFESSGT